MKRIDEIFNLRIDGRNYSELQVAELNLLRYLGGGFRRRDVLISAEIVGIVSAGGIILLE